MIETDTLPTPCLRTALRNGTSFHIFAICNHWTNMYEQIVIGSRVRYSTNGIMLSIEHLLIAA